MKRAQPQAMQSSADAALQYRILAMGRVQAALGAQCLKARAFVLSLSPSAQRSIAAGFAIRLGRIEQPALRARLLVHLGQIHGELATSAERAPAAPSHRGARPGTACATERLRISEYAPRR